MAVLDASVLKKLFIRLCKTFVKFNICGALNTISKLDALTFSEKSMSDLTSKNKSQILILHFC